MADSWAETLKRLRGAVSKQRGQKRALDPAISVLEPIARGAAYGAGTVKEALEPGSMSKPLDEDPSPFTTENAIKAALGITEGMTTGSMPFRVPAGALRAFGGRAMKGWSDVEEALANAMSDKHGYMKARDEIWDRFQMWKPLQGMDWRKEFATPNMYGRQSDLVGPQAPSAQGRLSDLIGAPEAFEQYPGLANIPSAAHYDDVVAGSGGYTRAGPEAPGGKIEVIGKYPGERLDVFAHEIQHPIQQAEGFSSGGHPNVFSDDHLAWARQEPRLKRFKDLPDEELRHALYESLFGEVEARAAAGRRFMTQPEIQANPPWKPGSPGFQDRNPSEWIVFPGWGN